MRRRKGTVWICLESIADAEKPGKRTGSEDRLRSDSRWRPPVFKPGNAGTSLRMCKRRKSLCPWHAGQGYHQAYRGKTEKSGKAREEISYGRHRPRRPLQQSFCFRHSKNWCSIPQKESPTIHGCGAGDGNRISDGKSGYENIKITTPEDCSLQRSFLAEK